MTNTASSAPLNPSKDEEALPMMVHVIAPASLPAGYTFEAEINGDSQKTFTCEVPGGGVEEGQIILVPLPYNYNGERLRAPTGAWKDGLFDFLNVGICHPSTWCSLLCTQIAMGQIVSRMQLTWLGEPGSLVQTSNAFRVVVVLVACYVIYSLALELAAWPYAPGEEPTAIPILRNVGGFLFTAWSIYSLYRTRQNVRARYQIAQQYCIGYEDLCCAVWCSFCTTAQMLRHTGEYETYPGVYLSPTGHPPGTPLVV